MNRITGHTQMFLGDTWIDESSSGPSAAPEELPPAEVAKVTGNAGLGGYGWFSGKLYNGSSWTLSEVTMVIAAIESDGSTRWRREFTTGVSINPLTTESFTFEVSGDRNVSDTKWSIRSARGFRGVTR